VPQVYYVGLLAGENDLERLERTGVGRDVNRHAYTEDEVLAALDRPVVRELCDLIRLRNTHPAFGGEARVLPGGPGELGFEWRAGTHVARLEADLGAGTYHISTSGAFSPSGRLPIIGP